MSVDIFTGTSSTWTCPYCTFINDDGLISCATCYQARPGHKKQKTEKKETWTAWVKRKLGRSNSHSDKQKTQLWFCNTCNKFNNKESSKCDTCGGIDGGSKKNYIAGKSPGWACSQCTYQNSSKDIVCEQCGNCKRWDDEMSDDLRSHDAPHGTPVDVIVISDDDGLIDDDDIMIVDHQGQDHIKCSKCDLCSNSKCLCCDTSNMKLISSDKAEHATHFDSATQWECADCSYHNDNKRTRCGVCDSTNKKVPAKPATATFNPSTHWECSRCSLHNSNKHLQCVACGTRRKHPSVDESASSFDPVTQWKCAKCLLYNDNKQSSCSVCHGTKKSVDNSGKSPTVAFNSSTHWRCPSCPTINNMVDIQCAACGTKRKHPKVDTSPFNPATQWECATCSLYNDNKHFQCTACHGVKKAIPNGTESSTSALNPATHWECIHCSLHNSNSRSRCDACHHLRPKDVTLVRPVVPYTKQVSIVSEPEESISKRTRIYSNHTALVSLSVKNKRDLIDQDALDTYGEILKFCKQVMHYNITMWEYWSVIALITKPLHV